MFLSNTNIRVNLLVVYPVPARHQIPMDRVPAVS